MRVTTRASGFSLRSVRHVSPEKMPTLKCSVSKSSTYLPSRRFKNAATAPSNMLLSFRASARGKCPRRKIIYYVHSHFSPSNLPHRIRAVQFLYVTTTSYGGVARRCTRTCARFTRLLIFIPRFFFIFQMFIL